MRWFLHVTLVINQGINTLLGGDHTMTMSARVGYARERGAKVGTGVCRVLDWLDPHDGDAPKGDHCTIAVKNHEDRQAARGR